MRRWLRVLFTPRVWFPFKSYSRYLDEWLREALASDCDISYISHYRATIGGKTFWIANGMSFFSLEEHNIRPSRATTLEAWDAIQKAIIYKEFR